MYISIEFNPAAFKHGVSETDIRLAILNALYDDALDDTDNKHLYWDLIAMATCLKSYIIVLMNIP